MPQFPVKTSLAIVTLAGLLLLPEVAPALKDYKTLEWHSIPAVLDFASRKSISTAPIVEAEARLKPTADNIIPTAPATFVDATHNLDHFFAALSRTETKKDGAVTRILHYGDSPTTADLITADTRADLQKQFGDAGHGFCLIAKPWAWYGHRGVDMSGSNWKIDNAMQSDIRDGLYGLGGVSFRGTDGASAKITVKQPYTSIEVAYLAQPDGGSFTVETESATLGTVETVDTTKHAAFASFPIADEAVKFFIRVKHGPVRMFGAQFTKPGPGIIYDSLGVNGAYISILAKMFQEKHWAEELQHYKPDLVIVNYGTNESVYPKYINEGYVKEIKEAVRRLKAALPESSILIMSPMDRGQRDTTGEIVTVPVMLKLVDLQRQVAADTGCGFFNTFQAMGGPGTMGKWYGAEPRLVGADFIHPMPAGAKIVGHLLYKSLLDGYNQYKRRELQQRIADSDPKATPAEHSR